MSRIEQLSDWSTAFTSLGRLFLDVSVNYPFSSLSLSLLLVNERRNRERERGENFFLSFLFHRAFSLSFTSKYIFACCHRRRRLVAFFSPRTDIDERRFRSLSLSSICRPVA